MRVSQLVKGRKDMQIDFSNLQYRLSRECGVEFNTCPVWHIMYMERLKERSDIFKNPWKCFLSKNKLFLIQWETSGN